MCLSVRWLKSLCRIHKKHKVRWRPVGSLGLLVFLLFVLQFFFFLTGHFYFIYLFLFCAACFNTTATPQEGCGRPLTPASVERKDLMHVACFWLTVTVFSCTFMWASHQSNLVAEELKEQPPLPNCRLWGGKWKVSTLCPVWSPQVDD